jgi:archaellum biogenesis protein FlaJ (TadC family)
MALLPLQKREEIEKEFSMIIFSIHAQEWNILFFQKSISGLQHIMFNLNVPPKKENNIVEKSLNHPNSLKIDFICITIFSNVINVTTFYKLSRT